MPIQTLGLFDRIFSWVYDKLLSPVIKWLSEILGNIFKEIFEVILLPFLQLVFGTLWDAIVAPILDFFYRGVYTIYAGLLWIVDLVQQGFDVLIGLKNVSYLDEASGEVMETTLLNYILFDDTIRTVLIAVTFVAVALCIAFSIYAVMRSTLDFDFENKRPVGRVLTMTAKTLLTFLMIPLIVWVGLNLASHALVATATALSGGQSTSLSDTILAISSMDAARNGAEFSMSVKPWSDLMDGTTNLFLFPFDVHISKIDYLVGFASSIFCLIIMLMCLFTFIRRIYDIVVLYIVSPYFASTMVLDDGQKFNSWRDAFIGKVMIGYGSAIGMRIFLMLVPIIMGDEIQLFDSVLMNATGGYVLKLIFVLGGMYAVYKSSSLLTSIVNSRIGAEEAMGNSRMLHRMGHGAHQIGHAAAGALKGLGGKKKSTGNKQPLPAGPAPNLDGAMKIDGKTGATAKQSAAWKSTFAGLDIKDDYEQSPTMHIDDFEDMSDSFENLFQESSPNIRDVEDMSDSFENLFQESTPNIRDVDDMSDSLSDLFKDPIDLPKASNIADVQDMHHEMNKLFSEPSAPAGPSNILDTEDLSADLGNLFNPESHIEKFSDGFGTLSVGGQQFNVPKGYAAVPKLVPTAKAGARIEQMKRMGDEKFGSYYDAVSSSVKSGNYSTPTLSAASAQFGGVTQVNGHQLNVPSGFTVVPEIMKVDDAIVAANNFKGGKNQQFYSSFASTISNAERAPSRIADPAAAPKPAAPAPKPPTSSDIASLEAKINTSNK